MQLHNTKMSAWDHLKRGLPLPRVTLSATDGSQTCLAELRGRSVVIVYPWTGRPGLPNPPNWDDIPGAHGSTPEIEGFGDLVGEFAKLGVSLYGLSNQPTEFQQEMVQRLKVPFPILSDADGRFAAELCLPSFATGGVNYLKRLTLVVKDGQIEKCFYPVRKPARHATEVLSWLRTAEPGYSRSSSASSIE